MKRFPLLPALTLLAFAAAACASWHFGRTRQIDAAGPSPERVRTYEQAAARERAEAAVVERLATVRRLATDIQQLAQNQAYDAKYAAGEADDRARLIRELAAAAAGTAQSETDALTAVDRFRAAAHEARQAAAAYGAAPLADRPECASRADGAAMEMTSARDDARRAVSAAADTMSALLSKAALVRGRAESFGKAVAHVESAGRATTAQAPKFDAAVQAAGPSVALASELVEQVASMPRAAAAIDRDAAAVGDRARTSAQLLDAIEADLSQQRALISALRVYLAAEVDSAVEQDAETIVAALHTGALRSCGRDDPCRARLIRDLAMATSSTTAARASAAAARRDASESVAAAKQTTATARRAVGPTRRDAEALDRLAAAAGAFAQRTEGVEDAFWEAYRDAFGKYERAWQAAEDAYLAAYGKPRGEPRPTRDEEFEVAPPPPAPVAAPPPPPPPPLRDHAWEIFTRQEPESTGYGAYTYVLFRHRADSELAPQIRERYRALLVAIASTTLPSAQVPSAERGSFNLFCIPGQQRELGGSASGDVLLANYDASLSFAYLSRAGRGVVQRADIRTALQSSPGPFLLTTLSTIESAGTTAPILFVDLSPYHAQLFPDLLAAYKEGVQSADFVGQAVWKPGPVFVVGSAGLEVGDVLGSVVSYLGSGGTQAAHAVVH